MIDYIRKPLIFFLSPTFCTRLLCLRLNSKQVRGFLYFTIVYTFDHGLYISFKPHSIRIVVFTQRRRSFLFTAAISGRSRSRWCECVHLCVRVVLRRTTQLTVQLCSLLNVHFHCRSRISMSCLCSKHLLGMQTTLRMRYERIILNVCSWC